MSIKVETSGDFSNTMSWLKKNKFNNLMSQLEHYGQEGVTALQQATPKRTGLTASSWYYEITQSPGKIEIAWKNSHVENNVPIAVILQYGHGTGTGGYVQGIDYINPAMKPVFDEITNKIWKEIASL